MMTIPEKLLHFIWRFRLYDQLKLKSQSDEAVRVLDPGTLNENSGPDFLCSTISIGGQIWVGQVEIHVEGRAWYDHGHDKDDAYDNVVLHVIWENQCEVSRKDGTMIPTLVLKNYVDQRLLMTYQTLMETSLRIPCHDKIKDLQTHVLFQTLDRMQVERLKNKAFELQSILEENSGDWELTTKILLCRSFGMRVNKDAFTKLGSIVNWRLFERLEGQSIRQEALIFGQSGLLSTRHTEQYPIHMKKEFEYLKNLFGIPRMDPVEWKFMRMRPANFPTLRLAQLTAMLSKTPRLFQIIMKCDTLDELKQQLVSIQMNEYWKTHFRFDFVAERHSTNISKDFFEHLIVNCFAVIKFSYGQTMGLVRQSDTAFDWINQCRPENNAVTKNYEKVGFKFLNAGDTQGILHLKTHYCDSKNCLDCTIGYQLMSRKG